MDQLQLLDDWKLSNPIKGTRKSSLKKEILELQRQLEDQFLVRNALEKAAVGYWKSLPNHHHHHLTHDDAFISLPAKELIKEISALELEVVYLERYLVSLYKQRRGCYNKAESPEAMKVKRVSQTRNKVEAGTKESPQAGNLLQCSSSSSSIRRCYSSLSHRFNSAAAISRALDSHHSLPLSLFEDASLNGGGCGYGMEIRPNWVSEEMVKCISSIYCELAQPSSRLEVEGSSYSYQLREVGWMSIDVHNLQHVQHKMQRFRSLVSKLERVEAGEMNHGEKLAFWINVHNSLVMQAFLEYGIPRNHIIRTSLVLKAAYNVGGRTVSVDMIQTSILGCHLPRPAQWLRVLLYPRRKLKIGDSKRPYSITTPDPRLYFALCTGNHSDPPLRVYCPETVFEDLEAAKQDYIQASLNLHRQKNNKVMLPKIVDCFAKDSQLCPAALVETELDHLLPASVTNSIRRRMHHNKPICWVPHSFDFRYLISRESMEDLIQPNSIPGSCSIQNS